MNPPRSPVLITGASRGIGAAVAGQLAASGREVVLWARSAGGLAEVAAKIGTASANVRTAVVDVGDAEQVRAAAAEVARDGGLSGVVLNAGHGVWRPLAEISDGDWEATLRTNLSGAFHVLRAVLPMLVDATGGLVVGLLSDSAIYSFADRAAYSSAKAGMRSLLEVARREARDRGVRFSLVYPSRVDTCFSGSHRQASPGTRPEALAAEDVAAVIRTLFELPRHVEIRELHLAAMTATFGPYPERVA